MLFRSFTMATWGLPGLGNFVAEFLTLVGVWQVAPMLTILAAIGLVAATAYSLRILQKVFYGSPVVSMELTDLSFRERIIMGALVISIIWLGLFPQPVLNTSIEAVNVMLHPNNKVEASVLPSLKTGDAFSLREKGGSDE